MVEIKKECRIDRIVYKNIDVDSFKIVFGGYSKDKNHIYYWGKVMDGVDPNNFEMINFGLYGDEIKIKDKCYFNGKQEDFSKCDNLRGKIN